MLSLLSRCVISIVVVVVVVVLFVIVFVFLARGTSVLQAASYRQS